MTKSRLAPWLSASRWPTAPIRLVARLGSGHTPSRSKPEYWENCTVPWITLADVWQLRDGRTTVITDTKEKVSPLGLANSAAVKHPAGTVILSRTASVGFSAIMGQDMATSQDFATWTCGPKLEPRYLLHALRGMTPDLKRVATGSTHKTIYMPDIEQLRVPLPPLEEQRRIADFLDAETSRMDTLASSQLRLVQLLKERESASIDETFREAGWREIRLKHLLQAPLSYGANEAAGHERRDWPRYIRTTDITEDGGLREHTFASLPPDAARRHLLKNGDLLFVRSGATAGKSFLYESRFGPAAHAGYLIRARVNQELILPRLIWYFSRTPTYWQQISEGTIQATIQNVNAEKYGNLVVPYVEPSRQASTLCELDSLVQRHSEVRQRAQGLLALLSERRQTLITAAVTGQFDVSTASGRNVTEGVTA